MNVSSLTKHKMDKKDKKEYKNLRNEVRKLDIIIHLNEDDDIPDNMMNYLQFLRDRVKDIHENIPEGDMNQIVMFVYKNMNFLSDAIEERRIMKYQKELLIVLRTYMVEKMSGIKHTHNAFIDILKYLSDEIIHNSNNEKKKTRKHKKKPLEILSPIAEGEEDEEHFGGKVLKKGNKAKTAKKAKTANKAKSAKKAKTAKRGKRARRN